ncbi:hypothetical protein P9148_10590 [Bacillus siamensis]|nr:hypothetical protein [Bacillus siamensis]
MKRNDELKKGESGTMVTIAAYPVLSAMKLIIGYVFTQKHLLQRFNNN